MQRQPKNFAEYLTAYPGQVKQIAKTFLLSTRYRHCYTTEDVEQDFYLMLMTPPLDLEVNDKIEALWVVTGEHASEDDLHKYITLMCQTYFRQWQKRIYYDPLCLALSIVSPFDDRRTAAEYVTDSYIHEHMHVVAGSVVCERCQNEHDGSYASGRFCSERCMRSARKYGKTASEETKRKMSEAHKRHSLTHARKVTEGHHTPHTEETKRKMSEAHKRRWLIRKRDATKTLRRESEYL
jgi:hypothetical protein